MRKVFRALEAELRDLVIREEGSKYCLYTHDGKRKLGCHDTKEDAVKQEQAIKSRGGVAAIDRASAYWLPRIASLFAANPAGFPRDLVEKFCEPCARTMEASRITHLKFRAAFFEGKSDAWFATMCSKWPGSGGFSHTDCTESMGDKVSDAAAFCAALEKECTGFFPAENRESAAGVYEKDGEYCHKMPDGSEMCHKTREEAETHMAKVMKEASRHFKAARDGVKVRVTKFNDRDHLVVPVIALVEGVIHASNADTPELVLADEFKKNVAGWNGRPVMLNHPNDGKSQIPANDPKVLDKHQIGTVFNARVEDKKLRMDAYLDIEKMEKMGDEAMKMLSSIRDGKMNEVSVGTFVVAEPNDGKLGDSEYKAVWREIASDHLAFLPEGIEGACSIEMGCGTRAAGGPGSGNFGHGGRPGEVGGSSGGGGGEGKGSGKENIESGFGGYSAYMQELGPRAGVPHDRWAAFELDGYESEYDDGESMAVMKGSGMETSKVSAAYDKAKEDSSKAVLGYKKAFKSYNTQRGSVSDWDPKKEQRLEKASEKLAGKLGIEAGYGRVLDYREQQGEKIRGSSAADHGDGDDDDFSMEEEVRRMTKKQRIAAIIASGKTCFKTADEAVLDQFSDERLVEIEEHVKQLSETKPPELDPKIKAIVDAAEVEAKKTPEAKREEFLKANPDIADVVAEHKAAQAKKRETLVGTLKTAQKVYTEAELNAMPIDQLEKVSSLVVANKPKTDFSGQAPRAASGETEDSVPPPPSLRDAIIASRKAS